MLAGILEYAALAMAYSVLAAGILETLLRLWRVQDPPVVVRFRLVILALPPLAPLLYALLSPGRGSEAFRQQVALLDLRNWLGSEPGLLHPGWILLLAVMAATTMVLAATDGLGLARHLMAARPSARHGPGPSARLQTAADRLAARGILTCPVVEVGQPEAAAWMAGLWRPSIVVTTALVDLLDDEELEGVLAHEMAHVRRRDNWVGWIVFALRLLSFYNPVALLTFHQIGHGTERVCDAEAGEATGRSLALASALIKVYTASRPPAGRSRRWPRRLAGRAAALENRARRALVEDRVERLVHSSRIAPTTYPGLRLVLALAAVAGIMYLVV